MELTRSSGVLMPISALPSKYGIGTLGKAAYDFIDFLSAASQKYWQILPVGPLSYGDSPYQSLSTYAGNPYFVDLDLLVRDGLLKKADIEGIDWGSDPCRVDYGKLFNNRFTVLKKAADKGLVRDAEAVAAFEEENKSWLPDYTLFMALKRHFNMQPWSQWPDEDIRLHKAAACRKYRKDLAEDIRLFTYIQFLFFKQWDALKAYAGEKGVGIIGDLPIYVAMDSADVWSEPHWFQLDEANRPTDVSGVPPDYFSADGQLWGNPLYRWDKMKRDHFGWWVRRVGGAFRLYDVLGFDHFRGLECYWAVPSGVSTAKNGRWVKGPGMDLIRVLTGKYSDKSFIAEDLGFLTPEVKQLLADSGFPGMKVLEFAFDSREESDYLPHTYPRNCICYTGTHDNATIMGWKDEAAAEDVACAVKYLGLNSKEGFNWGMIRGGMSSVANLFVAQMQDYLGLGSEARVNIPGFPSGNWTWRMEKGAATAKLAKKMAGLTKLYGRAVEAATEEA
ncbi:MAG: 4-alpha-glucanotransferase [Oscillospiraceae bacterium]|nr:4-alpha-glucanotransferase [Oscillospiraceae bacterium]